MKIICQDNNNGDEDEEKEDGNNGDEDEEKEDGNCNGKYDILPHEYHIFVVALQQPKPPLTATTTTTTATTTTTTIKTVRGLPVHRVPLRQQQQQQQQQSPYCYALSSITDLPSRSNFLATQVWPSARVAAKILEERFLIGDIFTTITTMAAAAATTSTTEVHVIATDVDEYALDLVNAAAIEQGLDSSMISTRTYDLINGNDNDNNENENECCWMDDVDLFVMSDVFESAAVAIGAARLTYRVLYKKNTTTTRSNNNNNNHNKAKFFVFSQNDRVQRDVYIRELRNLIQQSKEKEEEGNIGGDQRDDDDELVSSSSLPSLSLLNWSTPESYNPDDLLWLCEVDETQVNYG
ncbi:hypothetical protein FRACYDRAFT_239352 [Fragilariopsis cylindrus CCMP1102]|uniref:Uncharacterized protein n=1 Tax=Fragilariopsis cylindrus CCMP1102 TaxID=635003 RepID=A0A1E7FF19_9STRA|nr:hypothetical protein FRACYDRAFT_239352 [Fragilariopsis cylindrus CCMP1102]|eukprot:OEU16760.1 hypothetical protein FRACYDRAFT_239352 [Fragilariopsis cylindrus CCMP1102]